MKFLLDTNICSAHMHRPARLAHRFIQHVDQLAIPTIVLGELYAGAYRRDPPDELLALLNDLLPEVRILDFDAKCAERFGVMRGTLLRRGISVSTFDLMIAAVAVVHDLTLVTNNVKGVRFVPDLRVVDWLKP